MGGSQRTLGRRLARRLACRPLIRSIFGRRQFQRAQVQRLGVLLAGAFGDHNRAPHDRILAQTGR